MEYFDDEALPAASRESSEVDEGALLMLDMIVMYDACFYTVLMMLRRMCENYETLRRGVRVVLVAGVCDARASPYKKRRWIDCWHQCVFNLLRGSLNERERFLN